MFSKRTIIIAAVSATVAVAGAAISLLCSRPGKQSASDPDKGFELLSAIPSDAVALNIGADAFSAFESVPGQKFADLPLSSLKEEQAVVSHHFYGEMTELIAMTAGKNGAEPEGLGDLLEKASRAGIFTEYIKSERKSGKPNVLLMSESENLLASSLRNISENASILDIAGFRAALSQVAPKSEALIFRNDAVKNLLPNGALGKHFSRTVLCRFLSKTSEWTVLKPSGEQTAGGGQYLLYDVVPILPQGDTGYLSIMDKIQPADSKVSSLIPQKTTLAIDLPIADIDSWLSAREAWLDATSSLVANRTAAKKVTVRGKPGPVEWARDLDVKEVVRVAWRSYQVLLVRPGKTAVSHNVKPNPYRGYLAPVFGDAFKLVDESCVACIGHWYIIGSSESVKKFLSTERRMSLPDWPQKGVKFVVMAEDYTISQTRQGMSLGVYNRF